MARTTGTTNGVRTGKPRRLYLDDETIERAKVLGNGSASAGIREAVFRQSGDLPPLTPRMHYAQDGVTLLGITLTNGSYHAIT